MLGAQKAKPVFRTERGYGEFDRVIGRLEGWIGPHAPTVLCYSRTSVGKRVVQRIVELGLSPFIRECARCDERGIPFPAGQVIARFPGFSVEMSSGQVRLNLRLILRAVAEFTIHWVHVLGVLVWALLDRAQQRGSATLLFGVGNESLIVAGNDARFLAFCMNGPIEPLSKASRLIVQAAGNTASIQPGWVEYARFPLFALLKQSAPDLIDGLRLMAHHVHAAVAYVSAVLRFPVISILGRDFAYHAMVRYLDGKRLIQNILITNSNYTAQPLWMSALPDRAFRSHMLWYSQNSVPLVFSDDPIKANISNYRHMRVDVSWVWTEAYAVYLRTLGVPGEIRVVGPILWYLPPAPAIRRDVSGEVVLTMFDITPVNDAVAESLGLFGNYYNAAVMTRFVEETLSVCRELEEQTGRKVRLSLKHKRSHNPRMHDSRYLDLVSRLAASDKGITLIPFETNMYELLMKSHLAVVVPYSSPAYVSSSCGTHAVYFDPTGALLPSFEPAPLVKFASGREELLQVAVKIVTMQ